MQRLPTREGPNVHVNQHAFVRDPRSARDAPIGVVNEDSPRLESATLRPDNVSPCSERCTRGMDTPRLEIVGEERRITATAWLASLWLAPSTKSWFK